jgi:ABC-type glycerol-3-phosphate transport system permease component
VATYAVLVVVAVLTLLPLAYAFFASFKSIDELLKSGARLLPKVWDLGGYRDALAVADFGTYLVNSIIVVVGVVLFDAIAASMLGYVMARRVVPGIAAYQGLLGVTLFVGVGTATLYPRYLIADSLGLNGLLGIVLVEISSISVIHSFLVMSFVSSLPAEIEEAARVDGCGLFGSYRRIALPLMRPVLATTTVLAFQHGWNNFEIPFVFTLARPNLRTLVIGVYELRVSGDSDILPYNLMLAGAMLILVPIVVVFLLLQRYFVRGLAEGALKG